MIRYIITAVGIAFLSGLTFYLGLSGTFETVALTVLAISLAAAFVMLFVDGR